MREIKFRGKPIEDYGDIKWFYGGIDLNHDDKLAYISTPYNGHVPVEWESIGQYTGLKDDTGREIYEGDVVKFKSVYYENKIMKAVVKFKDSLGAFVFDMGDDQGTWIMNASMREIEVIGNIYENPDLLEAAE
ncbi:YopX family protein [Bacillus sp. FSL M8-0168]